MPEQITLPTFDELIASSDRASESAKKWEFVESENPELESCREAENESEEQVAA